MIHFSNQVRLYSKQSENEFKANKLDYHFNRVINIFQGSKKGFGELKIWPTGMFLLNGAKGENANNFIVCKGQH